LWGHGHGGPTLQRDAKRIQAGAPRNSSRPSTNPAPGICYLSHSSWQWGNSNVRSTSQQLVLAYTEWTRLFSPSTALMADWKREFRSWADENSGPDEMRQPFRHAATRPAGPLGSQPFRHAARRPAGPLGGRSVNRSRARKGNLP